MVIELSVAKLIADSQDTDFCRTISNVFKDAPMKRVTLLSENHTPHSKSAFIQTYDIETNFLSLQSSFSDIQMTPEGVYIFVLFELVVNKFLPKCLICI